MTSAKGVKRTFTFCSNCFSERVYCSTRCFRLDLNLSTEKCKIKFRKLGDSSTVPVLDNSFNNKLQVAKWFHFSFSSFLTLKVANASLTSHSPLAERDIRSFAHLAYCSHPITKENIHIKMSKAVGH